MVKNHAQISLTDYPKKRSGMLQLAGKLSVPQVFVGDKHLGDADAVTKLSITELKAMHAAAKPPADERLQKPTYPPEPEPTPSPRTEPPIKFSDTVSISYLKAASGLSNALTSKRTSHRIGMCSHVNDAISQQALEEALVEAVGVAEADVDGAVAAAENSGVILSAHKGSGKLNLYRLQQHADPDVLNRYRVWKDRVDPADVVVFALKKRFGAIKSSCTDKDGHVSYLSIPSHDDWPGFLEAFSEIQGVDLSAMDEGAKKSFIINLYNLCILVAFSMVGIAQSDMRRLSFFDNVKVDVGGHLYSFNQLESGLLRGNRKVPFHLSRPFAKGDKRLAFACREVDNRIHFALNCGAKSCPPVKRFRKEAVHEELDVVATAFFEDNLSVEGTVVTTTTLFKWYKEDFGGTDEGVLQFLARYTVDGPRKDQLKALLKSGKFSIKFFPYSWETDSANNLDYAPPSSQ
eukprot:gene6834-10484_t